MLHPFPHPPGHFVAIEPGKPHVDQGDVRLVFEDQGDARQPVRGRPDLVPLQREEDLERVSCIVMILDHHDASGRGRRRRGGGPGGRRLRREREPHDELTALPEARAVGRDAPTVLLDEGLSGAVTTDVLSGVHVLGAARATVLIGLAVAAAGCAQPPLLGTAAGDAVGRATGLELLRLGDYHVVAASVGAQLLMLGTLLLAALLPNAADRGELGGS